MTTKTFSGGLYYGYTVTSCEQAGTYQVTVNCFLTIRAHSSRID